MSRFEHPETLTIKFYKDAVPDILAGRKTLEARPRSPSWIRRVQAAKCARFTYGPRFGSQTVFARAKIISVSVRPFETATREDLESIALGWETRTSVEFAREYERWFESDLSKGYPVVWISFKVLSDTSSVRHEDEHDNI